MQRRAAAKPQNTRRTRQKLMHHAETPSVQVSRTNPKAITKIQSSKYISHNFSEMCNAATLMSFPFLRLQSQPCPDFCLGKVMSKQYITVTAIKHSEVKEHTVTEGTERYSDEVFCRPTPQFPRQFPHAVLVFPPYPLQSTPTPVLSWLHTIPYDIQQRAKPPEHQVEKATFTTVNPLHWEGRSQHAAAQRLDVTLRRRTRRLVTSTKSTISVARSGPSFVSIARPFFFPESPRIAEGRAARGKSAPLSTARSG